MSILSVALLVAVAVPNEDANAFLTTMASAVHSGQRAQVEKCFESPLGAKYLFEMGSNRGGLKKLSVAMVPVPPGWPEQGKYWVVFHTVQTIEEDHDPVYLASRAGGVWKLGKEVAEDDLAGWRIDRQSYRADLHPDSSSATIHADIALRKGTAQRAPAFRLNDNYQLSGENVLIENEDGCITPNPGQIVRAGSLLIPWTAQPAAQYTFDYSVTLPQAQEDEITPKDAYLTAWWLPSLGRLPFTVEGTISAPSNWVVRAEGERDAVRQEGDRAISRFSCPLPISYPKVIGGLYTLAAQEKTKDGDFRIYQLQPVNQERADRDLKNTVAAAAFYAKVLGPLPFHGYECYDADRYYGIESYSHTLLQRDVTHFISHEMGHTYFGGLGPCAYVKDSWNEGVTQYIDSVAFMHDGDKSLESALQTLDIKVPLSDMAIPWNLGGATYTRGCYVMKMLEAEIGKENVYAALKEIAFERKGMDTRWADLRTYFERTGKKPLGWFWQQWVFGSSFPTLTWSHRTAPDPKGGFTTTFHVSQSGVDNPLRVRFELQATTHAETNAKQFVLEKAAGSFQIHTVESPHKVKLEAFPFALAKVKAQ